MPCSECQDWRDKYNELLSAAYERHQEWEQKSTTSEKMAGGVDCHLSEGCPSTPAPSRAEP